MTWTDERVATLKRLWGAGLSASEVANELGGVTRNAVIGKVSRLGLCGRKVDAAPKPPRVRAVRRHKLTRMMMEDEVKIPIPKPITFTGAHKCTLEHLSETACRYPLWDESAAIGEKFFCGVPEADVIGGVPYCPFHMGLAFTPRKTAQLEAAE